MGMMIDALVNELEQEAATTRRVLERVPNDLSWKPNPKSMSLGQLAMHVATIPGGVSGIVRQSPCQVPQFTQPSASSSEELLPALGIKVARGCSYHGVALNVAMDLTPFASIDPCGYAALTTVDLATLGVAVDRSAVGARLAERLVAHLAG